jgi:hypothetical protein
MPDLETQATTEDPASEIEKFQKEFQGARYQRDRDDDGDGKATLESEAKTEPPEPVDDSAKETFEPGTPADTPPVQDGTPQVKLYTVPDQEMYGALRGQKVTAAQLEEAGLIGKVITRDHQEMHNAKLYNELKREFEEKLEAKVREMQASVPKQPAEPEGPQVTPKDFGDNVERSYVPVLKKLAESGSFEPDIVEAYPRFVSHIAHQLETMRMVGAGLVKAVQETKEWVGMQEATTSRTTGFERLHGSMQSLASDELYAPLADATERQTFIDWMSSKENRQPWKKLDIVTELSDPETLKGAYAAYRTATRHLRKETTTAAAPDTRDRAKMASGGGGTSRKATGNAAAPNEFEQLKKELHESRAQSFGR